MKIRTDKILIVVAALSCGLWSGNSRAACEYCGTKDVEVEDSGCTFECDGTPACLGSLYLDQRCSKSQFPFMEYVAITCVSKNPYKCLFPITQFYPKCWTENSGPIGPCQG